MSKLGTTISSSSGIEIGSMTTTTRNAGVGTATGTLIYNSTTEAIESYFGPVFGWQAVYTSAAPVSITGGTVTTNGSNTIHTYLTTDPFAVSGGPPTGIEMTIMAVGGGGGATYGGAGGAPVIMVTRTITPGTYTMTVGGGGATYGTSGGQTIIFDGSPFSVTCNGGGPGGGAVGGNAGAVGYSGGNTPASPVSAPGTTYGGYTGSTNTFPIASYYFSCGGAGAGGNGSSGRRPGVDGVIMSLDGTSYYYGGGGGGNTRVYTGTGGTGGSGGGGGGGVTPGPNGAGTPGPGGTGGRNNGAAGAGGPGAGGAGGANTGGGGGGASASGGSGIIIISYASV